MPFDANDPLSSLGLEEPGAEPQGESAWSGIDDWPTASDERADQAERRVPGAKADWDSPDNPYKTELEKLKQSAPSVGQKLDTQVATLQNQAAEAWDILVQQQKWPAQLATTVIGARLNELTSRAELDATREAALPHVRRGTADKIAGEFSDKKAGVVVNPDELLKEDSAEAMRATAKALATERRDHMVAQRRSNHTDRAEGGPPGNGRRQLPDESSPALRIQYGLERGHL